MNVNVYDIKYKGEQWLLIGTQVRGTLVGVIAKPEDYEMLGPGYAYANAEGKIMRHYKEIGSADEIEILGISDKYGIKEESAIMESFVKYLQQPINPMSLTFEGFKELLKEQSAGPSQMAAAEQAYRLMLSIIGPANVFTKEMASGAINDMKVSLGDEFYT